MFAPMSDSIPPSSLGFAATLSVAMELERRLNEELHDTTGSRAGKRADGSPTELPRSSPALPTGGAAKHHEEATDDSDQSSSCGGVGVPLEDISATAPPEDLDDEDADDEGTPNPTAFLYSWDGGQMRKEEDGRRGKQKTYRCKQCCFVGTTKADYWEHNKTHIKAEKLLTCPNCPFVTEYKHHLEYHLRNHYGSKPFKCDQCSYSCVNKSMLNSHMKSHSNIYQFHCGDCTYATKYCHSLKLHLRKYGHSAADPTDGRRAKRSSLILPNNLEPIPQPQPQHPFLYPSLNGFPDLVSNGTQTHHCNLCEFTTSAKDHLTKHMLVHAATDNQDLCSLYGISSSADPILEKNELILNAGVRLIENTRSIFFGPSALPTPLDLSSRGPSAPSTPSSCGARTAIRHRRKGKAFKLDRICLRLQDQNEENPQEPSSPNADPPPTTNGKDVNECPYCEIIFKDCVMYAVHMGYHGYQDPFQCNMCGQSSKDKVSFFLHIARTAHL